MPRRTICKGWYHDPSSADRFRRGWAVIESGRAIETGPSTTSPPGDPDVKGIVLPPLPNAHTHLGDFLLRDKVRPGMSVEELVAPPDGLKHRLLPGIDIQESIGKALASLRATGTGSVCDFREGGVAGVEAMARALVARDWGIRATILGRPKALAYSREEVDAILRACDGIGISGIGDWDWSQLSDLAAHVRRAGGMFALHASEVQREDMELVLDLSPDFVVHMTKADRGDLHRLSGLGIPVVVCPRSNMFYGREPPVRAMLETGVQVCLGTDNAMMSDLSMFGEASALRALGLDAAEVWGIIENSWKLLNREDGMHIPSMEATCIVVGVVTDDPVEALTGTGSGLPVVRP